MKAQAISQFVKLYGREPKWIVSAPGRVNIIGEHTDYNDGFVFPMAIERRTVIAAAPAEPSDGLGENEAKIWTSAGEQTGVVSVAAGVAPTANVPWTAYIQGTLTLCAEAGFPAQSFVAVMLSDVPLGGGLSSSAALEVSVATLCEAISGKTMDPVKKCLLCQKAEHEFAHMPCGIMDQFISNLGQPDHAMLLDCRSCVPEMVPLTDPAVSILIINSNVKHALTGSEYPERRAACEQAAQILGVKALRDATMDMLNAAKDKLTETQFIRARHVITEDDRTVEAAAACKANDWVKMGELMYQSHASMRDDFQITCSELDTLVDLAAAKGVDGGVYGARMTGGGFGGCAVALVKTDAVEDLMAYFAKEYEAKTGIKPFIFVSRPGNGSAIES